MNKNIATILDTIKAKKKQLDQYAPLPKDLAKNMGDWLRVELTYTSNAIEGNTLTRQETALVVEDGLTPAGKTVIEILEARNHNQALTFIIELAKKKRVQDLSQKDILAIHTIILQGINSENAGVYRHQNVRIAGSQTILPNYIKVPDLMQDLEHWLQEKSDRDEILLTACDLHYKFVKIHPFVDGNGRTGRLLFNLLLLIAGYPLAFIAKKERNQYLNSLETIDNHGDTTPYYEIMLHTVERSLDLYLEQILGKHTLINTTEKLYKIGELAKLVGETVPTIRYWTQEGLLPVIHKGKKNYAYYDERAIVLCGKIRELQQNKRYSLMEIGEVLGKHKNHAH